VEISSFKRGAGHGNRRLQKAKITNAGQAPIPSNLIAMDFQNFIQTEENDIHVLFCQALEHMAVFSIDRMQGFPELTLTLFASDWRD